MQAQKKIQKLSIAIPCRTTYIEGEIIDVSGLVLVGHYSDGTTSVVKDYTFSSEPLRECDKTVTFFYNGQHVNQPIFVKRRIEKKLVPQDQHSKKEPIADPIAKVDALEDDQSKKFSTYNLSKTLVGLCMESPPQKISYIAGEPYDLSGTILQAVYDDGHRETVSQYQIDKQIAKKDDTSLIFSYQGKTISCPVQVASKTALAISILQLPQKLKYFVDEQNLSLDGGKIRIVFNDGTTEERLMEQSMITGFNTEREGVISVILSYAGAQTMFSVEVLSKTVIGLQIRTLPKTIYMEGQSFDPSGLELTAIYSGGSKESVSDYRYSPERPLTCQDVQVIISFRDKAVILQIQVVPTEHIDDKEKVQVLQSGEPPCEREPTPRFYPSSFGLRFEIEDDL